MLRQFCFSVFVVGAGEMVLLLLLLLLLFLLFFVVFLSHILSISLTSSVWVSQCVCVCVRMLFSLLLYRWCCLFLSSVMLVLCILMSRASTNTIELRIFNEVKHKQQKQQHQQAPSTAVIHVLCSRDSNEYNVKNTMF